MTTILLVVASGLAAVAFLLCVVFVIAVCRDLKGRI